MRALGTSFLLQQMIPQHSIRQNQAALSKAQVELSTQRHSDMLQQLAGQTGRNVVWHAELNSVDDSIVASGLHKTRAEVTQTSLSAASKLASDFLADLIHARGAEGGQKIIQAQAKNMRDMLRDTLNVEVDGFFLFAGRNQTSIPVLEFTGGPGETQFDAAFQAEFGISKTDPAVKNITSAQLVTFLNGNMASLFQPATWESTLSDASSQNVRAYVSKSQNLDILANAKIGRAHV